MHKEFPEPGRKTISIATGLVIGFTFLGCAAHTSLVPLGQGRLAPNISIGGPMVEAFGTHVPVPYLMAGAEYGVSDRVNVSGSVHVLALAYSVAGLDVGASWFPVENDGWRPTVGLGPRLSGFASLKGSVEDRFLFYPTLSASAAWSLGRGLVYAGADAAIPLSNQEYDDDARSFILSPFTGYRWNLGRRYALLTELKWHGMNIRSDLVSTGYTAIGNQGAVTPLVAIQRRF